MSRHPIRVVARRTGLSPDVLRAWEKRYQAVEPERSGNRRTYSDADVERLLLLRKATLGGRSIGQVARLDTRELRRLVAADEKAAAAAPGAHGQPARAARLQESARLEACLASIQDLESHRLEAQLAEALVEKGRIATLEELVIPLMGQIGKLWRDGSLRVAHEHMVSAVVRSFLGRLNGNADAAGTAPRLVISTPSGQHHELGALVCAATAASEGWDVSYLGPNLPAEEMAAAVRLRGARVAALSIVYPPDDPRLPGELRRLAELLPPGTHLVTGGAAAAGYDAVLEAVGAIRLGNMAEFRSWLERQRRPAGAGLPLRP